MEKMLEVFHNYYSSSPLARTKRGLFLQSSPGESSGILEVNPTKLWGLLRLQPQDFLTLLLVHTQVSSNPSKLPPKCSQQFTSPEASAPGCDYLDAPVYRFQSDDGLPRKLSSLVGPRKVVDFQFV